MIENDLNSISDELKSLVNVIRNIPVDGSIEENEISKVIFLDLYFRNNIDFESKVLLLEEEDIKMNKSLYNDILNKYNYAYNESGLFNEKRMSSKGISDNANQILRRTGIQCNTISGHILINNNYKQKYYKHYWNEIKINNVWYIYDFTLNLISYKYQQPEYKDLLKFIKVPITPIDYSFVKKQTDNVKIGGFEETKDNKIIQNINLISDDFSKYSSYDLKKLLTIYNGVENIYTSIEI